MKTKLDLFASASAFALETLNEQSAHAVASQALERFAKEGHDTEDWEYWHSTARELRDRYAGLATQKAPSAVAQAAAEQKKAAEAKAARAAEAKG